MRNTYLGVLWQHHRKLFVLACLFIVGAAVPVLINFEITPFYAWRMYAWPIAARTQYDTYVLHYDGKEYNHPHTFDDYRRMMVMYTMPHFDAIRQTGDTLPFNTKASNLMLGLFRWNARDNRLQMTTHDLEQYPAWLKRYIGGETGAPVTHVTVDRISVRYRADNRVEVVHRTNIIDE